MTKDEAIKYNKDALNMELTALRVGILRCSEDINKPMELKTHTKLLIEHAIKAHELATEILSMEANKIMEKEK